MKFDLPLLDYKTRFALWQVKMRAILAQSSDLDEALDGFVGKGQKSCTAEEKRKERKALSLIQLHLHNDILQEVLPAELWLKLESICMSKDLTSKMHIKMKLFMHKLQECGSVMNHLSIFKEIVADLVSMEVKYNDEDLALLLLCSLPTSFANFRDTILLSHDELTLVEVYEALQTREKMKGDVLIVFVGCVAGRDEWILDSACSFHICSNRDWFNSYKSVQSGDIVRMGDNNPREIVGIGSIQIKMHDGMICTLKDHMCLGHMSELGMVELIQRDLLDGCTVGKMKFCEHCVFGKHKRVKFNASVHITKGTLDYVHADLWGPSRKPSYGGARYMLTIIDDYSRKVWPYFLKNKDDTFAAFKEWKVMIERQTEKKHSPPVLQPQNQSIADHRTKRSCGPRPCLIEECDIVHYAFSCAEHVENIHEPATYTKAVVSSDREKWIFAMQEEMHSLEKNGTWDVVRCLNTRRPFVANGS
ncbi:unnamed protein product [Miscanthus lutarioriparius]|uniref:Uncharacterized protein n=1 Tax=Miscanthus lutarioriparius TaxID=422564 RepID=A0A811P943_9POAL|nr:unnamed protein product [Miscanthus lutarioriparius]